MGSRDLVAGPVPSEPWPPVIGPRSGLDQLRQHLVHVADDAEVGDREDRRLLVLVDGDDVLRALHAHHVLGGAGDAGGDVDGRLHDLAGLADLVAVGHPAGVDDGPRRAGRALQQLGQLLDHLVLAGLAEAAAAGHDDGGLVELRARCAPRRGRPSTLAAPVAPRSGTGAATTSAAPPPDASAANDFGRNAARYGPSPVNVVVTSVLPPKTGVGDRRPSSPSTAMSMLLVSTGVSSLTDRRASDVAAVVGRAGTGSRSGASPPSITACHRRGHGDARAGAPPRSPVA